MHSLGRAETWACRSSRRRSSNCVLQRSHNHSSLRCCDQCPGEPRGLRVLVFGNSKRWPARREPTHGSVESVYSSWLDHCFARPTTELTYPTSIAAGIGTVLVLEFVEAICRSKSLPNIVAGFVLVVLWIGIVLLLSQVGPGFSDGLLAMLCGSFGASAAELVTRYSGDRGAGHYRFQATLAGAVFGSLVSLMLLSQGNGERSLWFTGLSGVIPGLIISMGQLRRSLIAASQRQVTKPPTLDPAAAGRTAPSPPLARDGTLDKQR